MLHEIPIQILSLGDYGLHPIVNVRIGSYYSAMLLDTGASRTTLDLQFLREHFPDLVLTSNDNGATGLGGNNIENYLVVLPQLRLTDQLIIIDTELGVIDLSTLRMKYEELGMPDVCGILGMDTLISRKAVIDLEQKKLIFREDT